MYEMFLFSAIDVLLLLTLHHSHCGHSRQYETTNLSPMIKLYMSNDVASNLEHIDYSSTFCDQP